MSVIAPGATIGVLGGGQLGRMIALAAAPLGYSVRIYAPEAESVASLVAADTVRAGYDDRDRLRDFAGACDVITYEFENVPADAVAFLSTLVPVHPEARALAVSQDRLREKQFVEALGGRPAPFRAIDSAADLTAAIADLGLPAILKTRRFGYDGKGQVKITRAAEATHALQELGGDDLVLEGFVEFSAEFSILVARTADGRLASYPPCQNRHEDGILRETRVPATALRAENVQAATALAESIATRLDYAGVLACEFFDTRDGPVFNEMAPRVHNSGHWTIEGAETSQFEQHVRAICGLPLGPCAIVAREVVMQNLLGDDIKGWPELLADPAAHLHLYGKSEPRPGRKMGHVTFVHRD